MIKRLLVSGATAALVFGGVAGAFADATLSIENASTLGNTVNTSANTGYNALYTTGEGNINSALINTGNATAVSSLTNLVNLNTLHGFSVNSGDEGTALSIENASTLWNTVNTSANTGYNALYTTDEGDIGGASILTGAAGAGSVVSNVVNSNLLNHFSVNPQD